MLTLEVQNGELFKLIDCFVRQLSLLCSERTRNEGGISQKIQREQSRDFSLTVPLVYLQRSGLDGGVEPNSP